MGGATFSDYKTYIAGETLTASDLNSSHMNILNNFNFAGLDDYSSTATEMRVVTDPYPAGVESLATSAQGEIERLRYLIKQITGEAQWYIDPDNSLLNTSKPTYAGLTSTGAIDEAQDTIAAHATTCDIWSKPNNVVLSGGAVTFTGLAAAPQAGAVRWVKSNAAHVLTNNAVLIVQGGANVTLADGDWIRVEAITTTTFNLLVFRADGTAVVGGTAAGQIIQVVQSVKTSTYSTTSTDWAEVTDLATTITPTGTSDKILVMPVINMSSIGGTAAMMYRILRDSTVIAVGDEAGSRTRATNVWEGVTAISIPASMIYLDSPATTSAVTYRIQVRMNSATVGYLNRGGTDTDSAVYARTLSTLTLMVVKG